MLSVLRLLWMFVTMSIIEPGFTSDTYGWGVCVGCV